MDVIGTSAIGNECVEIEEKDVWNDTIEQYFIVLMVDEVKKGNRTTTTFSKAGWKGIQEGIKSKFGKEYTHLQMKNKYNSIRARQKNFKALIKETGIGYNSVTGEVNATEECWENLFKVHKMAKRFKRKGCKEFGDLCIIFGDTTATRSNAHPSTKSPSDSGKEVNDIDDFSDTDHEKRSAPKSEIEIPSKKRAKKTYSSMLEKALSALGEQSKRKNDLLEQKMSMSSVGDCGGEATSSRNDDASSIMECLKVLDNLGVQGNAFGKAVKAFHDSPIYRTIFMGLRDERKIDWVNSL